MENCAGCLRPIESRQFLVCSACNKKYDLVCANVSEQRYYSTLTPDHKATWRCPLCICTQPRTDNTNTPVRGGMLGVTQRRGAALASPQENLGEKSFILPTAANLNATAFNDTIEVADMQMLFFELRQFREEYREDRLSERKRMEMLAEALEKINIRQDASDRKYEQLQTRVDCLEAQVREQTGERAALGSDSEQALLTAIAELKAEINDRDQDLLLNDVEISCVSEQPEESLGHIAITLADKLGVQIADEDLVSVTRVGPSSPLPGVAVSSSGPRPRPIVIRFARRALRNQLIAAARVRRGATTESTGLPGPPRRFYVNERLTKVNRQLFRRTRELAAQHKWRFVWTRDGRIYVRQHQAPDAARHRIRSDQDLARVFGPENVGPSAN